MLSNTRAQPVCPRPSVRWPCPLKPLYCMFTACLNSWARGDSGRPVRGETGTSDSCAAAACSTARRWRRWPGALHARRLHDFVTVTQMKCGYVVLLRHVHETAHKPAARSEATGRQPGDWWGSKAPCDRRRPFWPDWRGCEACPWCKSRRRAALELLQSCRNVH